MDKMKKSNLSRRKSQDKSLFDDRNVMTRDQWAELKREKVEKVRAETKKNEEKIQQIK